MGVENKDAGTTDGREFWPRGRKEARRMWTRWRAEKRETTYIVGKKSYASHLFLSAYFTQSRTFTPISLLRIHTCSVNDSTCLVYK